MSDASSPHIESGPQVTARREAALHQINEAYSDYEQSETADALALHVMGAFEEAKAHRVKTGVEQDLIDDLLTSRNTYTSKTKENDDYDIYLGATNQKQRAGRAWLGDILEPAAEKPYAILPSPEPSLAEEDMELVAEALERELQQFGSFSREELISRAAELKGVAQQRTKEVAEEAAAQMEKRIHDQMAEGGFRRAFGEFLDDFMVYSSSFIKGPTLRHRMRPVWRENEMVYEVRPILEVDRISPFDIYPSPDASTPNEGAYLIERKQYSRKSVEEMMQSSLYDETALRKVLAMHGSGYMLDGLAADYMRDDVSDLKSALAKRYRAVGSLGQEVATSQDKQSFAPVYDCIQYYGCVSGAMLAMQGIEDLDVHKTYEAEIWVIGGVTVRAQLNMIPDHSRRIYTSSFHKQPGSFWGTSMRKLLDMPQRTINGCVQKLITNLSFTGGPIFEYDAERLENETDIDKITPLRMYSTNSYGTPTNAPAFRMHTIPTNTAELMSVIDQMMKLIDDISGIPAYILGNPNVSGAGRTAFGLSMMMGNAAKGIKARLADIDEDAIEPMVDAFVRYNMLHDPDPSIKGDMHVQARGATGLLQREMAQARNAEILQYMTPYAGLIPQEGMIYLLRKVLKDADMDPDKIMPDPQRAAALRQLAQGPGQMPGGGPQAPLTPEQALQVPQDPQLDGRSAVPPSPDQAEVLPPV